METVSSSIGARRLQSRAGLLARHWMLSVVALLAALALAGQSLAQIVGTGSLNIERRGHTATLLEDEKILIAGGENAQGPIGQAEIFDPVSRTSVFASGTAAPRTDHTATRLSDGRVLMVGGRNQAGQMGSTEIYNPLTFSFIAGPSMMRARSGHTATVLADGRILIAGGDATGSAEIYDPASQSFSSVAGSMSISRTFHGAARLNNGQVLIAGGMDAQGAPLNTAEIYDPQSQAFYRTINDMGNPRAFTLMRVLPDGKVQIIGGDSEFSMEVFDPQDGLFNGVALLPPNTSLLAATLSTASRAALISPDISQDALLQSVLTPELLALLDRADHSITEIPQANQALVAGGLKSSGQVLSSATLVKSSRATITTDKTDYAPGEFVMITGTGFLPNEEVQILFHEFPDEYPDIMFNVTANQEGSFITAEFAPQIIDIGRTFILTAIGQFSGFTAQTAFTDARNWVLTFAGAGNGSVTITPSIGTVNAPTSCGGTGTHASSQTVTSTCSPNIQTSENNATVTFSASTNVGSTFAGWSGQSGLSSSTCTGTTNPCSAVIGANASLTVTFNAAAAATTTTVGTATATYGDTSVTLSATATSTSTVNVGTVTFTVKQGATTIGSPTTSGTVTGGAASVSYALPAGTNAGSYTIEAVYSGGTGFNGSPGSGTLTINKANQTISFSTPPPASVVYNTSFTVVAAATSGLPVSYSFAGVCTNVAGLYTMTSGTGTCTVKVDQAGDDNYNAAPQLTQNVTAEKADATIIVNGYAGMYDGLPHGATGSAVGVLGEDLSASLNLGATFILVPGGTAYWTFTGGTNYNDANGSAEIVITTAFAYSGFYPPIGGSVEYGNYGSYANPLKTFKLNSTIPVKFSATWLNGGAALITGIHRLEAIKYSNSTDSDPPIDATPTDAATTGNQFRLTGTDWHFNLSTKALTAGTWLLRATLEDGSQYTVWITIKK